MTRKNRNKNRRARQSNASSSQSSSKTSGFSTSDISATFTPLKPVESMDGLLEERRDSAIDTGKEGNNLAEQGSPHKADRGCFGMCRQYSRRLRRLICRMAPCRMYRWTKDFLCAVPGAVQKLNPKDTAMIFVTLVATVFLGWVAIDILLQVFKGASAQSNDEQCSIVYVTIPGPIITVSLIGTEPSDPAHGTYYFSVVNGTTQWLDSIAPPTRFSTLGTTTSNIVITQLPSAPAQSTPQTVTSSTVAIASPSTPVPPPAGASSATLAASTVTGLQGSSTAIMSLPGGTTPLPLASSLPVLPSTATASAPSASVPVIKTSIITVPSSPASSSGPSSAVGQPHSSTVVPLVSTPGTTFMSTMGLSSSGPVPSGLPTRSAVPPTSAYSPFPGFPFQTSPSVSPPLSMASSGAPEPARTGVTSAVTIAPPAISSSGASSAPTISLPPLSNAPLVPASSGSTVMLSALSSTSGTVSTTSSQPVSRPLQTSFAVTPVLSLPSTVPSASVVPSSPVLGSRSPMTIIISSTTVSGSTLGTIVSTLIVTTKLPVPTSSSVAPSLPGSTVGGLSQATYTTTGLAMPTTASSTQPSLPTTMSRLPNLSSMALSTTTGTASPRASPSVGTLSLGPFVSTFTFSTRSSQSAPATSQLNSMNPTTVTTSPLLTSGLFSSSEPSLSTFVSASTPTLTASTIVTASSSLRSFPSSASSISATLSMFISMTAGTISRSGTTNVLTLTATSSTLMSVIPSATLTSSSNFLLLSTLSSTLPRSRTPGSSLSLSTPVPPFVNSSSSVVPLLGGNGTTSTVNCTATSGTFCPSSGPMVTRVMAYGENTYSFVFPSPNITTTISYWTGTYPTVTGPAPTDDSPANVTRTEKIESWSLVSYVLYTPSPNGFTTLAKREADGDVEVAAATTVDTAPVTGPTDCGESGAFTLAFDDSTIGPGRNGILPINGMDNPYHHLFYSNGFAYVPDSFEPFPSISQPNVAVFLPVGGSLLPSSAFAGTLLSGEIGAGPRAAMSEYWFNAYSGYFGCALSGLSPCSLRITGYRYSTSLQQEVVYAQQNVTIAACYGYIHCRLTQVTFTDLFTQLSGIQIEAYVDSLPLPQMFMMDDVALGWWNNSCSAGIYRIGHR